IRRHRGHRRANPVRKADMKPAEEPADGAASHYYDPMPDFLTDVHDRVATLTLNRPDKLNALSGEILRGSIPVLKEWVRDPEVGAIVLTGTGRAFCAGGDVGKFLEGSEDRTLEQRVDELREMQDLSWMLYNLPKVTLA